MTPQPQSICDLNSADIDTLVSCLQISPRLARRIVATRPFDSVADLSRVWGVDAPTYARLALLVTASPPQALPEVSRSPVAPAPIEPPSRQPVRSQSTRSAFWPGYKSLLLLAAILACGAYFRFVGLNWDENQHQHPDERFISMVAERIHPVSSIVEYFEFDTRNSSLNPLPYGSYTYGMLPLFLTRYVAEWVNMTHYDRIVLVGRALSGLFDLAAVALLYLLGARLYGRRVGLLAAALCAAAVLPIQLSHYFTVDSFSTVFVVAGFYFATRLVPLASSPCTSPALHERGWRYYMLFGLMTGMAAACKVNTLSLFGVIIVAGLARLAMHGTWRRPSERAVVFETVLAGWVIAAGAAFCAFRVLQPFAFAGPGFLGLRLNDRWLAIMREVTDQVAGHSEWPPNHHWTSRPFTYAWTNMVLWGLGAPLGLAAWLGWAWAAWRCWKGEWRRHLLPVVWVAGYFLWQNAQFWRYMRYFMPIYPFLILLAAWALVEAVDRARKPSPQSPSRRWLEATSPRLKFLAQTALVGVVVLTYAYAFAFTRIYVRPHTRIAASRWIMEHVPGPLNVWVNSPQGARSYPIAAPPDQVLVQDQARSAFFRPVRSGAVTTITATSVRLVSADWRIRLTTDPEGEDTLTEGHLAVMAGDEATDYVLPFREVALEGGQPLYLRYTVHSSAPLTVTGLALQRQGEPESVLPLYLALPDREGGGPGTVEGVVKLVPARSLHVSCLVIQGHRVLPPAGPTTLQVKLAQDESGKDVLAQAAVTSDFLPDAEGRSQATAFSFPSLDLQAGQTYYAIYQVVSGGPLALAGDTLALETSWDDALPLRVDGYDPLGGMYAPLNLELYDQDTVDKRERMLDILSQVNYIVVPSNRGYDAMPRLPLRYPLTLKYYQALFGCECSGDAMEAFADRAVPPLKGPLGFELVATFTSPPALGPLAISDQLADESFTVYDHPKVMIFKKAADFSLDRVRAILESVDLDQVLDQAPLAYTSMPTGLRLPPDRLAAQQAGGAWYDMFDAQSILNLNQALGVSAWYLVLALMGWLVFPFVFSAFPGLADRGYPLARMVALLLVAWIAWMLGSLKVLPFTRGTLWLSVGGLALVSGFLALRNRAGLVAFVRGRWRYLLGVECLFVALFLFDLTVRLGNPDLWHPWLGGEKPMNFAFFNSVLKAVYFPPANPWLSGHYLNYYYYGYVIAAVLTKLLGIVPSIAYNLILPTWFAMTGVGAFCVTFNLVTGSMQTGANPAANSPSGSTVHRSLFTVDSRPSHRYGSFAPYLAGILTVVLMLLLGNLYQVRQLWRYLPEVTDQAGQDLSVLERAGAVFSGAGKILAGQAELPGDKGRWYFAASRPILHDGPDTPIAEFPYFSFLYGDLHPHILAMPILFVALAWMLSVLWASGRGRWLERGTVWLAAGLAFGVLRPTHTWDFPTLLGLGALTLGWQVWRTRGELTRATLLSIAGRVLLLAGIAMAMYYPFGQWFGTEYSSLEFWKGARTPLADYVTVHGLFLFVLVTWLFWQTGAWVKMRAPLWSGTLVGEFYPQVGVWIKMGAAIAVAGLVLWIADYQVLTLGLLLWAWVGLLLWARRDEPLYTKVILGLLGIAVGLTMLVEVVVLKGDVGRSNTVFRFYTQVWALFSVAAGAALASLIPVVWRWSLGWRRGWLLAGTLLALAAASFTVTSTRAKQADRWPDVDQPPHQLDGMAFMLDDGSGPITYKDEERTLNLTADYAGIRFVQDHVPGTPTIVEGHTAEYRWGARYSIYTGLPTVVGWSWHVRQHNSLLPAPLIDKRISEVIDFYNTTDLQTALDFMRRYDVRYVIVGDLERTYYAAEGIAKFQRLVEQGKLQEMFSIPDHVSIYRVRLE